MSIVASFAREYGEQVAKAALPSSAISRLSGSSDFTRVSFSKNGRVHVESCCSQCNFRMLKSLDAFDDQERQHAAECRGPRQE